MSGDPIFFISAEFLPRLRVEGSMRQGAFAKLIDREVLAHLAGAAVSQRSEFNLLSWLRLVGLPIVGENTLLHVFYLRLLLLVDCLLLLEVINRVLNQTARRVLTAILRLVQGNLGRSFVGLAHSRVRLLLGGLREMALG